MSFIDNLKTVGGGFLKTATGATNPWTGAGMFLGNMLNNAITDNRQIKMNERLMRQQADMNKSLIDWKSPAYDVARLKEAGLNPALYYSGGGAGGAGVSGVQQGNTANAAEMNKSRVDMAMANKQLELMESEKQVNLAQANNLKSGSEKNLADTQTINEMREIEKTVKGAEAVSKRIDNMRRQWEMQGDLYNTNDLNTYNPTGDLVETNAFGFYFQKFDAEIQKLNLENAEKNENRKLIIATRILNEEKAKVVFGELLNGIKQADASMIRAKAQQLSTEFSTGEYINWKTWVDLGFQTSDIILDGMKTYYNPVKTVKVIKGK